MSDNTQIAPLDAPSSWVDFVGGARMKLHNQLAIEVQQGKMPNDPWYWYGVGGISRADRAGGCQTMEDAKSQAIDHARRELSAALNSLPNETSHPRFARFGEAVWKYITKQGGDFCGEEISEDILPLAQDAGLCCRVEYDPETHGEEIEADPGDEIWWWG